MDAILFGILVLFALALLFLGFFKEQVVLIVFAGIAFLIVGVFAINGLEYVSSTNITTSGSVSSVVDVYSPWNHYFGSSNISVTLVSGFLFSLFGLFLLFVGVSTALGGKARIDFSDDGDGGD
jgi:hypothetical protein